MHKKFPLVLSSVWVKAFSTTRPRPRPRFRMNAQKKMQQNKIQMRIIVYCSIHKKNTCINHNMHTSIPARYSVQVHTHHDCWYRINVVKLWRLVLVFLWGFLTNCAWLMKIQNMEFWSLPFCLFYIFTDMRSK